MKVIGTQYDIYQTLSKRENPISAASKLAKVMSTVANKYGDAGIEVVTVPSIPETSVRGHKIARYTVLTGDVAKAYSIDLKHNTSAIPPISRVHIGGDRVLEALEKGTMDLEKGRISDVPVPQLKPSFSTRLERFLNFFRGN